MEHQKRAAHLDWLVVVLPSLVVVLYNLLRLELRPPSAGGLSVLAAALLALWLAPRARVRGRLLIAGAALAALVAILMGIALGGR